jgi:ATP/maltotriose-dependent transcriptional regulator MalT
VCAVLPDFAPGDLDDAVRDGIVTVADQDVRFTHPLLASVHYARAEATRRRELHRLLADVISDEEERARHLALGGEGPDDQIAQALERAAGSAARRGAPAVAGELLEDAVRFTPIDQLHAGRSRAITAAQQYINGGDAPRARALLEGLLPQLQDGAMRARALHCLAHTRNDDLEVGQTLREQALDAAGDDHRLRADILETLTGWCFNRGQFAAEYRYARSALEAAERAGDPGLLAQMLALQAKAAFDRGRGVDMEAFEQAIRLQDNIDATTWGLPIGHLARVLARSDDFDAARPVLEQAEQRAVEHGEEYDRAALQFHRALVEWWLGNRLEADRYRAAADEMRGQGDAGYDQWSILCEALFAAGRGELELARTRAEEAEAAARRIGDVFWAAISTEILAAVELWSGQPASAHDRLHEVREPLLANGLGIVSSLTLGLWSTDIEALIELRRFDEAERVLDDLRQRAAAAENPHAQAIAHRCKGLLLAARGDLASAIEAMNEALVEHQRRPLSPEIGRTLLEKGSLERRAKRKTAAKQSLEQALAIVEPLGSRLWVTRTRDELGRIGLRRPTVSDGLTPAQTRAAELVAAGLSNREIATTLHMSISSVESHLAKVYREFGVRSRSQLVAALAANASLETDPPTDATHTPERSLKLR